MTRQEFQDWAARSVLLLDGATGSNLLRRGMPKGGSTELWAAEHPEVLTGLQQEYVQAGSRIVYAATFSANPISMDAFGLSPEDTKKLNTRLVDVSRRAVGDKALVAGDMTTVGKPLEPYGPLTFTQVYDAYCLQAEALYKAGADLLVAETMMGVEETVAAAEAARAACDLPLLCSFSVSSDGKCYFDGSLPEAAPMLQQLGVGAVGVNCSSGPAQLEALVTQLRGEMDLPILAKPNAGLPDITPEGEAVYSLTPEAFAEQMEKLLDCGARVLGGCCGTTPAHIRALWERLQRRGLLQS